jgi:hypothetical protein
VNFQTKGAAIASPEDVAMAPVMVAV